MAQPNVKAAIIHGTPIRVNTKSGVMADVVLAIFMGTNKTFQYSYSGYNAALAVKMNINVASAVRKSIAGLTVNTFVFVELSVVLVLVLVLIAVVLVFLPGMSNV